MDYKLALKLKSNGFPQKSYQPEDCLEGDFDCESCGSHFVYNPTLTILIDEIRIERPDLQFVIFTIGPLWTSQLRYFNETQESASFVGSGKNPEVAVSNLYISIKS